jgi:superfamily II DNA/RNA helicase
LLIHHKQVGRAGRFGTKGLAISFVATPEDKEVLSKVQANFVVQVPELPDELDATTYSKLMSGLLGWINVTILF